MGYWRLGNGSGRHEPSLPCRWNVHHLLGSQPRIDPTFLGQGKHMAKHNASIQGGRKHAWSGNGRGLWLPMLRSAKLLTISSDSWLILTRTTFFTSEQETRFCGRAQILEPHGPRSTPSLGQVSIRVYLRGKHLINIRNIFPIDWKRIHFGHTRFGVGYIWQDIGSGWNCYSKNLCWYVSNKITHKIRSNIFQDSSTKE